MWDSLYEISGEAQQIFRVNRIYFDFPPMGSDFWIDEFRITLSQPTGIIDLKTTCFVLTCIAIALCILYLKTTTTFQLQ